MNERPDNLEVLTPGRAEIAISEEGHAPGTFDVEVKTRFRVSKLFMPHEVSGARLFDRIRCGIDDFYDQIEIYCREAS